MAKNNHTFLAVFFAMENICHIIINPLIYRYKGY